MSSESESELQRASGRRSNTSGEYRIRTYERYRRLCCGRCVGIESSGELVRLACTVGAITTKSFHVPCQCHRRRRRPHHARGCPELNPRMIKFVNSQNRLNIFAKWLGTGDKRRWPAVPRQVRRSSKTTTSLTTASSRRNCQRKCVGILSFLSITWRLETASTINST